VKPTTTPRGVEHLFDALAEALAKGEADNDAARR
jgi:hypothetical protein